MSAKNPTKQEKFYMSTGPKKKITAWSSQNKNTCRKCGYVKCQCKKK